MPRKIALVVGYGQSNEQGAAVIGSSSAAATLNSPYGYPLQFPSTKMGVFHLLADQLGREGHAVWLRNLALGGTGLLYNWNGCPRAWVASSTGFAVGSWVLPGNGYKYRAGGTPGVSQSTGASQPTWPTSVDATVVDNAVTWTCKAADGNDALNRAYLFGESGYDPAGFIAAVVAAVVDSKARGFETWVLTSGHQNDYLQNIPTVATLLANMMQRCLSVGADRVYMGITNRYVGDASAPAWDPGGFYPNLRDAAFALMQGDPRVFKGADGGVITLASQCDPAGQIHLNDAGTRFFAPYWRAAISM